jgi:hypothetical protein
MSQRSHAFSHEEAPTMPARRGARRAVADVVDDEVPTTLRRSGTVRTRPAPRRTPPPLPRKTPPPLPRKTPPPLPTRTFAPRPPAPLLAATPLVVSPASATPTVAPPRLRSLASILEPAEEEPCLVIPARALVLPPDPESFTPASADAIPARKKWSRESTRWLVRIALMMVVLAEELVLAAPPGALHRPADISDAGSMLASAIHSSIVTALEP